MEIDCYKKAISRRGGGQQSLAQSKRKHPLSADCEFISPRFRSRSESPVRRAAPQHLEVMAKVRKGPFVSFDTKGRQSQMLHHAHFYIKGGEPHVIGK